MELNGIIDTAMPKATLKIERRTLSRLKATSTNMDDTYDTLICRLLDENDKTKLSLQVQPD